LGPREPRIGIDTIHVCTSKWRPGQGQALPWRQIGHGREIIRFSRYSVVRNAYGYLTIAFSPQILLFGAAGRCNTKALTIGKIRQAVARLDKLLQRDGFVVDLQGATISRLDLFCDLSANDGFSKTIPVLMKIKLPHLHAPKKFRGKTNLTLYYSNKSREICMYDKAQELLDKGILSRRECLLKGYCPDKFVRVEYRLRSPRSVRTSLGLVNLGDFLSTREIPQRLERVYNHVTFQIRHALGYSRDLCFPNCRAPRKYVPVRPLSNLSGMRSKPMSRPDPHTPNPLMPRPNLTLLPAITPRGPPQKRGVRGREQPPWTEAADAARCPEGGLSWPRKSPGASP
jgi:hypothetical protein